MHFFFLFYHTKLQKISLTVAEIPESRTKNNLIIFCKENSYTKIKIHSREDGKDRKKLADATF